MSEEDKSILANAHATDQAIKDLDMHFKKITNDKHSFYFNGENNKTTVDFGDVSITHKGDLRVPVEIYTNFTYFTSEDDGIFDKDDMNYRYETIHVNKTDSDEWEIVWAGGNLDFTGTDYPLLKGDYIVEIESNE